MSSQTTWRNFSETFETQSHRPAKQAESQGQETSQPTQVRSG